MSLSGWKIFFSIVSDLFQSHNSKESICENEHTLLQDMMVMAKPYLMNEGFTVILYRKDFFTTTSKNGLFIHSLRDLEIGKYYITQQNTIVLRENETEVKLGRVIQSKMKINLKLKISDDPKDDYIYQPTISGTMHASNVLLALESFTKRKLESGMLFYEVVGEVLVEGHLFKHLDELMPNTIYLSEDSKVKLRRVQNGQFDFRFASAKLSQNTFAEDFYISRDSSLTDVSRVQDADNATTAGFLNRSTAAQEAEKISQNMEFDNITSSEPSPDLEQLILDMQQTKIDYSIPMPIPPPPPPPPPMMNGKKETPVGEKKKKMRPLRWSTIPKHQLQATVWADSNSPVKSAFIKENELERLFSISPMSSPAKQKIGNKTVSARSSILPIKRSNNISIVLSRLPSIQEIRDSILLKSENVLTADQLISLRGILPITEEDETALRNFKGEASTLNKAEEFVSVMSDIRRLSEKVNCLIFMKSFDEYFQHTSKQIDDLMVAIGEVQTSVKLPQVLKLILAIGSVLNRDTYLSGRGFRLQSLKQITETKAKQGKLTLLNYLAELIGENSPHLLTFEQDELPHCATAAGIPIDNIIHHVKVIDENFKTVEQELMDTRSDKENNLLSYDEFTINLSSFYTVAKKQMQQLHASLRQVRQKFVEVGIYFGEDPSDAPTTSSEFFVIIHQFSRSLLNAHADNHSVKALKKIIETPSPQTSLTDVSKEASTPTPINIATTVSVAQ